MGANVNAMDLYGCTPLHYAAIRGNEIATKELLMCKSINIEVRDFMHMLGFYTNMCIQDCVKVKGWAN